MPHFFSALRRFGGALLLLLLPLLGRAQSLTQTKFTGVVVPQYMGIGNNSGSASFPGPRLAVVFRATVTGLTANTTYRYYTQAAISTDLGTSASGAGNPIFITPGATAAATTYTTSSSASLTTSGQYATFATDATGAFTGWFAFLNTNNATRFQTPGVSIFPTITIGSSSGTLLERRALDVSITTLGFSAASTNGTLLTGSSGATAKDLAALYDNVAGTGRPLTIALIESVGIATGTTATGANAYSYPTAAGSYTSIIPNANPNGVQRVEERSVTTGAVLNCATDADGSWPSGANTVSPAGGTTAVVLTATDTPLNAGCSTSAAAAPAVTTIDPATGVTTASATIAGNITSLGSPAASSSYGFVYSTSASTAATLVLAGTGVTTAPVGTTGATTGTYTITLTSLAAGTTYYYRAYATNATGTGYGDVKSFTTTSGTTITTGTVGSPICVGASGATISVPFTATGTFNAGNTFSVELSTVAGAFPGTVLTTTGTASPLTATVPAGTATGTAYRVRVTASSPATTGTNNGADLTVVNYQTNEVTGYAATAGNSSVTLAWTNPTSCSARVVIVARRGSAVTAAPTGTFTANAAFGSGTDLGTGASANQYVVYDGNGSSATVTGLANGSQYFFKAFTSNGDGFSNGTSVSSTPSAPLTFTEVVLPQVIQGHVAGGSTNPDRLPYAYRATLGGLTPNATYRYFNSAIDPSTDNATATGVGNAIFPAAAGGFMRSTSPSLSSAGNYGTLQADATGRYTGWFVLEPSGNTRFDAGKALQMRIVLNDGNNGTAVVSVATIATTVAVRQLGTAPAQATGVQGASQATGSNFVFAYDNAAGTGRPLAGTYVESDGTANTTANSYTAFYGANVDGQAGAWGLLTPNDNANGIRRLEQRDLATGAVVGCPATSSTGTWPSGTATASPSGGTTPLVITQLDAPLTCDVLVGFNPAATSVPEGNGGTTTVQLNVTVPNAPASALTVTVADAGAGTATAGTDYTFATQTLTFTTAGTQTVTLVVNGDRTPEPNETVQLSLTTSGAPATVANSPATVTILDDDTVVPSLLLEEDFDYPAGTQLVANSTTANINNYDPTTGWAYHSSTSAPIATTSGNNLKNEYPQGAALTLPPANPASPAVSTRVALASSGQDINKQFSRNGVATVLYMAAVVSVSAAQAGGDYFLHFYDNTSSGATFRGKVFARSSGSGINFGLSVSANSNASGQVYASTVSALNTPYLLVVKYENSPATNNTDAVSLFVFNDAGAAPFTPQTEPGTPFIGPLTATNTDFATLNAVALRQGSASGAVAAPTLTLDGLRVATTWGAVVGRPVFTAAGGGLNAYVDATTNGYVGNYYDVTVNNADQVAVSGMVNVENSLNLTSGLVLSDAADLLVLAPAATVSGGSSTSFVSGPVSRPIGPVSTPTSFVFPVGKGSSYRPLTLNATTQTGTTVYRAEQFEGNPGQSLLSPDPSGTDLKRVSVFRYYSLTPFAPGSPLVVTQPTNFTGSVTLSFGSNDRVTDLAASSGLVVAKRSDSTVPWANFGLGGTTGTPAGGTVTSGPITSFSDLALGSTNPDPSVNPLPVQLVRFTAARTTGTAVALAWTTASELRSAYFAVERSLDGHSYAQVTQVNAQGSTTQAHAYAALDAEAPAGRLYYRLRQADQDGTVHYSPLVTVASTDAGLAAYPNPTTGLLTVPGGAGQPATLLDAQGRVVRQLTLDLASQLDLADLPAGLYLLRVAGQPSQRVAKQ